MSFAQLLSVSLLPELEGRSLAELPAESDTFSGRVSNLLRAIYRGDLARAERDLGALTYASPEEELLGVALKRLLQSHRYTYFPGGQFYRSEELEIAYPLPQKAREAEATWSDWTLRVTLGPMFWLARWLFSFQTMLPNLRYIARNVAWSQQVTGNPQTYLRSLQDARTAFARHQALPELDWIEAELRWRAGDVEAGNYLQSAFDGFNAGGNTAGTVRCLLSAGDWQITGRGTVETLNHDLAMGIEDSGLSLDNFVGDFSAASFPTDNAHQWYEQAAQLLAPAAGELPRTAAQLALRRGYLARLTGDQAGAEAYARTARSHFEAAHDTRGAALALVHQTLAALAQDPRREAVDAFSAVGEACKKRGEVAYAVGLGQILAREGRRWNELERAYEHALGCARLATELFQAVGFPLYEAQTRTDQGKAYQRLNDGLRAQLALTRARRQHEAWGRAFPAHRKAAWQRSLLVGEGVCLAAQTRREPESLELATRHQTDLFAHDPNPADPGLLGEMQNSIPGMVEMRRETSAILVPLLRAIKRSRVQDETADPFFAEAWEAIERASDGQRELMRAIWYRARKDHTSALRAYEAHKTALTGGFAAQLLQQMVAQFGELAAGQQRIALTQQYQQAISLYASIGAWPEVMATRDSLVQLHGDSWWRQDELPFSYLMFEAQAHRHLQGPGDALTMFERATVELDRQWAALRHDANKLSFYDQELVRELYFFAAEAALAADRGELAWRYLEMGLARALRDLLAAPESDHGLALRGADARRMFVAHSLAHQYDRLPAGSAGIAQLETELDAHEAELVRLGNAAIDQPLAPPTPPPDFAEVCAALPAGTLVLQYAYHSDRLLGWAFDRTGLRTLIDRAVDTLQLDGAIHRWRAWTTGQSAIADPADADTLAAQLLRPFAAELAAAEAVAIVPYGRLQRLAFQTLQLNGEPLGLQKSLTYLPSASLLPTLSGRITSGGRRALIVGNPAGMALRDPDSGQVQALSALPGAEREARYVAKLFDAPTLLCGEAATEAAVRAALPGADFIHLATHGWVDARNPLNSAIALANGERLSVYELMEIRLRAELVVLSACDTASGRNTLGGDVIGLTRGLLAAGARTVIVSQWPVHDAATQELMQRFYEKLRDGTAPERALLHAQRWLRQLERVGGEGGVRAAFFESPIPPESTRYVHPRYWAPFILAGGVGRGGNGVGLL